MLADLGRLPWLVVVIQCQCNNASNRLTVPLEHVPLESILSPAFSFEDN